MSRLVLLLVTSLLGGCLALPGSDSLPVTRFMLQGTGRSCEKGDVALTLSIVKVGAGLNTDRIARIDNHTGEMTYLKGVRWVEAVGPMMEQRLAADLECAGYAVQTGHRTRLGHDQLACEVRALNLLHGNGSDQAVAGLSCLYYDGANKSQSALIESGQITVASWNSARAMEALSSAYAQIFDQLVSDLNSKAQY